MRKVNLHLWKNGAISNGVKVCVEENTKGNNELLMEIIKNDFNVLNLKRDLNKL